MNGVGSSWPLRYTRTMPALRAMNIVSSGRERDRGRERQPTDDDLVDEAGRHARQRRRSWTLRKEWPAHETGRDDGHNHQHACARPAPRDISARNLTAPSVSLALTRHRV